jgi:hypothetical protein
MDLPIFNHIYSLFITVRLLSLGSFLGSISGSENIVIYAYLPYT